MGKCKTKEILYNITYNISYILIIGEYHGDIIMYKGLYDIYDVNLSFAVVLVVLKPWRMTCRLPAGINL